MQALTPRSKNLTLITTILTMGLVSRAIELLLAMNWAALYSLANQYPRLAFDMFFVFVAVPCLATPWGNMLLWVDNLISHPGLMGSAFAITCVITIAIVAVYRISKKPV